MLACVWRLVLAIVLVVGGLTASPSASALPSTPCHHVAISLHHGSAAVTCGSSSDNKMHCLTAAGLCCTVALPAASETVFVRHATTMAWGAVTADDLAGERLEAAIPPPRI
jgi:hypothetical protein